MWDHRKTCGQRLTVDINFAISLWGVSGYRIWRIDKIDPDDDSDAGLTKRQATTHHVPGQNKRNVHS